MNIFIPSKIFLTKGKGKHKEKLASLELALRDAGIAPYNLVKISSILPPYCEIIPAEKGIELLTYGQILFLIMSECSTQETHRLISASVGVAVPDDSQYYGYLAEHHSYGQDEKEAGHYAEDLAAYMLATTIGVDFNLSEIWDEEKNIYKITEDITVRTQNVTQTAIGTAGLWTTVVAAAVCIT